MKYKVLNILIFFMVVLFFFYTYHFFQSPESIATFQSYTAPSLKLNKELIDAYHSDDVDMKKEAEEKIIQNTLEVIEYKKWQDFAEYIDMKLYQESLLPQESQQLVITLNLSKDLAVVVIFDTVADDYIYHSKIENIVPVSKVEFISNPTHSYKTMLVYQTLDEKFGSFFYEEFLQVYLYHADGFRNIWNKTLYYEEIYKEVWVDPKADENLWNKVIEETVIDIIQDAPLTINTFTTLEKYATRSSQYPQDVDFHLIHTENYKRSYYWSEQFNTFILGEVSKDVFISDVALLEDMESAREVMYGIHNHNYKIITSQGEIVYLPKNNFQAMFQSFLEE